MQTDWLGGSSSYELAKQTYTKFRGQFQRNIDVVGKVNGGLARQIANLTYWIFDCDPRKSLTKCPIYVLGFNPGANDKDDYTQKKHWDKLETWDITKEGNESCLVDRIRKVVEAILKGLSEIERGQCTFATVPRSTLYFFRTHKAKEIDCYIHAADGTGADFDCWDYHNEILSLVRPSVILCYGNGRNVSTFTKVCDKLGAPLSEICDGESWYNGTRTRFAEVNNSLGGEKPILLIGVPHLSRYNPDAPCCVKNGANRVLAEMTRLVKDHSERYPAPRP